MEATRSVKQLSPYSKQETMEFQTRVIEVEKEVVHLEHILKVELTRVTDALDWEGRGDEEHRGVTDDS